MPELRKEILIRRNQSQEAIALFSSILETAAEPEAREVLYKLIAEIFTNQNEPLAAQATLEAAVGEIPDTGDLRFKLAYSYSQFERTHHLAIYHYKILQEMNYDSPAVSNNLALLLMNFNLMATHVDLLKRSGTEQNLFATLNITRAFLRGGFVDEAAQELKKISEDEQRSERVTQVAAAIARKRSDEKEQFDRIAKKAFDIHEATASAIKHHPSFLTVPVDIAGLEGKWIDAERISIELAVDRDRKKLSGTMIVRAKISALNSLGPFFRPKDSEERFQIDLGRFGGGFLGAYSRPGKGPGLLLSIPEIEGHILLYPMQDNLRGLYWKADGPVSEIELSRS